MGRELLGASNLAVAKHGVHLVQDLDKTHLILWTDNPDNITTDVTRVRSVILVVSTAGKFKHLSPYSAVLSSQTAGVHRYNTNPNPV